MNRPILLLAPLLAVVLAACSAGSDGQGDGGSDGGTGVACEPGQTRCDRLSYQECIDGFFTEILVCQAPLVCAQGWGCVDCNPAWPTVCVGDDVHACDDDATIGGLVERCSDGACAYGACEGGCSAESQKIYVVDDTYRLLSFSPAGGANEFSLIGRLSCQAGQSWPAWGNSTATPFSMSVDRSARAWVLYTSGEIFWVDTTTGACAASPYQKGQGGYELFGMGFVSDAPGSENEKLFIAGGEVGQLDTGNVAVIDPDSLQVTTVGPVPDAEYSPELTGTGDAKFYAYFPGLSSSFVAELDKDSGWIVQQWPLPSLTGSVRAWAFAHWGGRFYVFITTLAGGQENSQVLKLDPQTGQTETLLQNLDYIIVGAGVSTCAPTYEP